MIRWVFRPFTQMWPSICTLERSSDLHLCFQRLHPLQVKIIIFRVENVNILLKSFKKIRIGRRCWGGGKAPPPSLLLLSLRINKVVFSPQYSIGTFTPWSVFQDGTVSNRLESLKDFVPPWCFCPAEPTPVNSAKVSFSAISGTSTR